MGTRCYKLMRFKSKKAVVTGASSGIGRSIAMRLASEGAELVLVARRESLLNELKSEIESAGGFVRYIICDLASESDRGTLCDAISEIWPEKIDILVNAAGVQAVKPIVKNNSDLWHKLMTINVEAPADLLRKLSSKLGQGASVINISSVAGILAMPGSSVYAASKAALQSYTRSAAAELAHRGIRVNAVLPGMVKSSMMDSIFRYYSKAQIDELEKRPLMGFGTPEDVSSAVAYIASDEARWLTGTAFVIDGGFSIS